MNSEIKDGDTVLLRDNSDDRTRYSAGPMGETTSLPRFAMKLIYDRPLQWTADDLAEKMNKGEVPF
jgi:hypothetical protein